MNYAPERLRALIEGRGMSLAEVAAGAGMKPQYVHAIVSGTVANPGIRTIERIVEAAGVSMAEFYADEDG